MEAKILINALLIILIVYLILDNIPLRFKIGIEKNNYKNPYINENFAVAGVVGPSKVLGEEFDDILKGFAVAVYFKSFNLDIKERLCDLKAMTLDDFSKMKKQRVSAWANNFIVMDLEDKAMPKTISLKKTDENSNLRMTIIADLEDGRRVQLKDLHLNDPSMSCRMNLADMKSNGVQELLVIITNSGAERYAGYEILQY